MAESSVRDVTCRPITIATVQVFSQFRNLAQTSETKRPAYFACYINRSMQHLNSIIRKGDVAYELLNQEVHH